MATILIADDENHIRLLLEEALEVLEDEGVELVFAHDGHQALEIIRDRRPELVFLDVMMPGLNGYEVCREARGSFTPEQLRIVMLTAKGQQYDKVKGMEVGADEYLTKPFNPMHILDKARDYLQLG